MSDLRRGAENALLNKMLKLQERLEGTLGTLPATATELHDALRQILQKAVRTESLTTPPYKASGLLVFSESKEKSRRGGPVYAIAGGPKDFVRRTADVDPKERIVRDDGAVIHFTITVEEPPGAGVLFIHSYDFELYFPQNGPVGFVRFDLNKLEHKNSDLGVRSHLHPSHENLLVPSPLLSPTELLCFLVYGLRLRREDGRV
ncbi:hypothetical protein [Corallococcus exiguus]|uniref:hypothetical protein n=1 Tax=Corallococcus exiguus TaxID=83462 RepID=UPI003DA3A885